MIFIGNDDPIATDAPVMPAGIAARDLLAACAAEAERQAATMSELDAALGAALQLLRASVAGASGNAELLSALVADLQLADRLRQESEGLARVLALLATVPSLSTTLPATQVQACTPFAALQLRLLTPSKRDFARPQSSGSA